MVKMDFHIHSNYSDDGEMTVWKVAEQAVDLGLKAIGIVDHVRDMASWFPDKQKDIEFARKCFDKQIRIFSGIEVSLLNHLPKKSKWYDYVIISAHSIPSNVRDASMEKPDLVLKWWSRSMRRILEGDSGDIIGHPDRILNRRHKVDNGSAKEFIRLLESSKWFAEINPRGKYPEQFLLRAHHRPHLKDHLVFGSDAHTKAQFRELHAQTGLTESALTSAGNERFLKHLDSRT